MAGIREEQAWLLQNRLNPFPVSGAFALEGGRVSFTLDAKAAEANLGWLEKELQTSDIKGKIEAGQPVVAFDYDLSECELSWPLKGGGAQCEVKGQARSWIVNYDYPSGGSISQTLSLVSGRRTAKEWKKAYAEMKG